MLSDCEIAQYQQEMEKILTQTNPYSEENLQAVQQKLTDIYEECAEGYRAIVGAYLTQFQQVMESGRINRIRKMYDQTITFIDNYKKQQELREEYIFDLKKTINEEECDEY